VSELRQSALKLAREAVELLEDPYTDLHRVFTRLSKALSFVLKAQSEEGL